MCDSAFGANAAGSVAWAALAGGQGVSVALAASAVVRMLDAARELARPLHELDRRSRPGRALGRAGARRRHGALQRADPHDRLLPHRRGRHRSLPRCEDPSPPPDLRRRAPLVVIARPAGLGALVRKRPDRDLDRGSASLRPPHRRQRLRRAEAARPPPRPGRPRGPLRAGPPPRRSHPSGRRGRRIPDRSGAGKTAPFISSWAVRTVPARVTGLEASRSISFSAAAEGCSTPGSSYRTKLPNGWRALLVSSRRRVCPLKVLPPRSQ